MHWWSVKSFNMLLQLLVTVLPKINQFPSSWSKCKQFKKDLGLHYEKLYACPNDCICIGMEGKTKKSATSALLHDGRIRKTNCLIRFYAIVPSFRGYSGCISPRK